MYGVILRIVRDENIAEEAVQDCFVRVWDRIEMYDAEKGRLFTWLINIARNLALDSLKTSEVKQTKRMAAIEDHSEYQDMPNVEVIGMKDILSVLTPEEKELIDLVYFDGYSHREIAKEFGIPLGTVKTRIRSAISKLRMVFERGG